MTLLKSDSDFEKFNAIFRLDASTGFLYYKVVARGRSLTKPAGTVNARTGYRTINLYGERYRAHQIVWLLHTGYWPVGELDHINHKTYDNRPENLRDVSRSANNYNRQLYNKLGKPGIFQVKSGKYRAMFGRTLLGFYEELEDAVAARQKAELDFIQGGGYDPLETR